MDLPGRPSAATKLPLAKNAKSAKKAPMKRSSNLGDLCVFARDQILSISKVTLSRQGNLRSKTRIQQVAVQGRKDRQGLATFPLSLPSLSSWRSWRLGESESGYAVPLTSAPRFRGRLGRPEARTPHCRGKRQFLFQGTIRRPSGPAFPPCHDGIDQTGIHGPARSCGENVPCTGKDLRGAGQGFYPGRILCRPCNP